MATQGRLGTLDNRGRNARNLTARTGVRINNSGAYLRLSGI
jgi:hypothetical protein